MSTGQSSYDAFVESSPQGSLFHKTWWLDAAATDQYKILTVERNGELLAALPVAFQKFCGVRLMLMPKLTPKLGILLAPSHKKKYADRLSDEMDRIPQLLALFPRSAFFCQRFSPEFTNWLPLYWDGFKQTTRYTYVIDDLSDLNRVWENIRYNTKRKIRTAEKHGLRIVTDLSLEAFLDLNEKTYRRQKLGVPYSRDYVRRIDQACVRENARRIFFAVDGEGRVHAAVYLVFDKKTAYYLMGGGDPKLNTFGAQYLALWEAIRFAAGVSQSFDFEGSMHSSIEPVFRGFGGLQKPYMEISKGNFIFETAFRAIRYIWNKGGAAARAGAKLLP